MIIIIGLPTMLVILSIAALFIVGSAVVYGIQSTWKGDTVAWLKPYTVKQKWGLFALLLGLFSCIAAFVYGWIYHNGLFGTIGFIGWIAASLGAAYLCSPLRLSFTEVDDSASKDNGFFTNTMRLASLLMIMVFSWVFLLIAIFHKATWRLFAGIASAFLVIVFIIIAVAAHQVGGWDKLFEMPLTAEEQLEKELAAEYAKGLEYIEQGEYFKAQSIFRELAEEHQYSDAAVQYQKAHYLEAESNEEDGLYRGAASHFHSAGDYLDAKDRYLRCNYLYGCELMDDSDYDGAISWFEKAEHYSDAESQIIYCNARIAAEDNLLEAEDMLRQLPRSMHDVDLMLSVIEEYSELCLSYNLASKEGDDPEDYTEASVYLIYEDVIAKGSAFRWVVRLFVGTRSSVYKAELEEMKNGALVFTDGVEDMHWREFEITKSQLKITEIEIHSKYGWRFERNYVFTVTGE